MARILVIGGAHVDRRARLAGPVTPGASNPDQWREEPGGAGFNAARNLVRLGHAVTMVAARGGDAAGETVVRAIGDAGIVDLGHVFPDRATPSYSAVLGNDGNLVIAVADMDLYDRLTLRHLSRKSVRAALAASDHVLCDTNPPPDTLQALAQMAAARGRPFAAIAVSCAKVCRLSAVFSNLTVLFLNAVEAAALCGGDARRKHWPIALRALGIRRAVITQGAGSVIGFDGGTVFRIAPPSIHSLTDVTGAGDALAAATVSALVDGEAFIEAVRQGIAAAGLAVRSPHAAPPELDARAVKAAAILVPQPEFLS